MRGEAFDRQTDRLTAVHAFTLPPLSSQGAVPLTYRLKLFLFFCSSVFFVSPYSLTNYVGLILQVTSDT